MSSPDNYSDIWMETLAPPSSVVYMSFVPSPCHSHNRWPDAEDVRSGTVFGEGQYQQQGYLTGTMSASGGGGTVVYTFVG